jgi:peptidoglycan hydrolase CwlO-like protein
MVTKEEQIESVKRKLKEAKQEINRLQSELKRVN